MIAAALAVLLAGTPAEDCANELHVIPVRIDSTWGGPLARRLTGELEGLYTANCYAVSDYGRLLWLTLSDLRTTRINDERRLTVTAHFVSYGRYRHDVTVGCAREALDDCARQIFAATPRVRLS